MKKVMLFLAMLVVFCVVMGSVFVGPIIGKYRALERMSEAHKKAHERGQDVLRAEYLEALRQLEAERGGSNAQVHLLNAANLYKDCIEKNPDFKDRDIAKIMQNHDIEDAGAQSDFIEACGPAFAELNKAVAADFNAVPDKPAFGLKYEFGTQRTLMRLGIVDGMIQEHEGNLRGACDRYLMVAQAGRLYAPRQSNMVQNMLAIAFEDMACEQLTGLLQRHPDQIDLARDILTVMTKLDESRPLYSEIMADEFGVLERDLKAANGADRNPFADEFAYMLKQYAKADTMTMPEVQEMEKNLVEYLNRWHMRVNPFYGTMVPRIEKSYMLRLRIMDKNRQLHLLSAALIYKSEHGEFPESLAALAPQYLKEIPSDPFTGEAMAYERRGNGMELRGAGPDGHIDRTGPDYDSTNGAFSEGDIVVEISGV